MSVVERIRQIQEEQKRKTAETEAAKAAAAKQAQVNKEENDKRSMLVVRKILEGSSILETIQEIEKGLLEGRHENHTILQRYINPSRYGIVLAWDYKPEILKGRNIVEHDYNFDYTLVRVLVDAQDETISIEGETSMKLTSKQWKDKHMIETSLANAFLHPKVERYRDSWGGWSPN